MSHFGALDTQAGPTLPPFPAQAQERRRSPRLPLTSPVRVGAPHGPAQAAVSATDLSAHGLFIDADRPVRVGARFSLEIPLPNGTRVYVSEAEVAYNRARPHGSGFGVRFVTADPGALLQIARAVEPEVVEPDTLEGTIPPVVLKAPPPAPQASTIEIRSDLPTLAPVDLSHYPEPEILAEALAQPSMISSRPEAADAFDKEPITDRVFAALAQARGQFAERARAFPRLWTGLCAGGAATIAAAIALTIYTGSDAEAVQKMPGANERGVSAKTHQALMGGAKLSEVALAPNAGTPAASTPTGPAKKPLPPLVVIEEPAASPPVEVAAPDAPAAEVIESKPEAPAKIEAVAKVEAPAKTEAPAKVDAPAKVEPVAKPTAVVAKVAPTEPSERAKAILGEGTGTLTLEVDAGARVLKTHALKSPDRFVIDLAGQSGSLELPAPVGRVKGLRAGKHPEYTRIVVDTTRPVSAGQVNKDGRRLVLTLHFE